MMTDVMSAPGRRKWQLNDVIGEVTEARVVSSGSTLQAFRPKTETDKEEEEVLDVIKVQLASVDDIFRK